MSIDRQRPLDVTGMSLEERRELSLLQWRTVKSRCKTRNRDIFGNRTAPRIHRHAGHNARMLARQVHREGRLRLSIERAYNLFGRGWFHAISVLTQQGVCVEWSEFTGDYVWLTKRRAA